MPRNDAKSSVPVSSLDIAEAKATYLDGKQAFIVLLDASPTCHDLLSKIKQEYEMFIAALEKGRTEAEVLKGQCKVITAEPQTLENLKLRSAELESNTEKLKVCNSHLAEKLKAKIETVCKNRNPADHSSQSPPDKAAVNLPKLGKEFYALKALESSPLSYDESLDIRTLTSYLDQLNKEACALKRDVAKNYVSAQRKEELIDSIVKKDNAMYHLTIHQERLKERLGKLRITLEALKESEEVRKKPVKQTMKRLTTRLLEDYGKSSRDLERQYAALSASEDDDPEESKVAEMVLDCTEDFNELIAKKDYQTAAWRAAQSPDGSLRTHNIMLVFKKLEPTKTCESPWLAFCDTLISTGHCYPPLSGAVSLDVIRCAVSHKQIPLALYWWNSGLLTPTRPMGDSLVAACTCTTRCHCGLNSLAHVVYDNIQSYHQAASCLVRCGLPETARHYCMTHNIDKSGYQLLVRLYPNLDLLWVLLNVNESDMSEPPLALCAAIKILHSLKEYQLIIDILSKVHKDGLEYSDGVHRSLLDCFISERPSEHVPLAMWHDVLEHCRKTGAADIQEELLACLEVRNALHAASYYILLDYIS